MGPETIAELAAPGKPPATSAILVNLKSGVQSEQVPERSTVLSTAIASILWVTTLIWRG